MKKKQFPLAKIKAQTENLLNLGTFDIETIGLGGAFSYATLTIDGIKTLEFFTADDLLNAIIELTPTKKGFKWYAHNSQYDNFYLLESLKNLQILGECGDVKFGQRGMNQFYLLQFTANGKEISIYDSYAIYNDTLENFSKQFSDKGGKLKNIIEWDTETFDVSNKKHKEYAKQDTISLYSAIEKYNKASIKLFGVNLKGTFSSTALAAWQVTLGEDKFYRLMPDVENFCRKAYFGGMVILTDHRIYNDVVSLDVNSMYPHCMRKWGVPHGKPTYARELIKGKTGIYYIHAKSPDNLKFGCLGVRVKSGIAWALGTFKTYAFDFEIERAKRWGYDISIIEGYYFDTVHYPFNDFINKCESYRQQYAKQPFEILVKYMQNSVYGKFGTKQDGSDIFMFADEIPPNFAPYGGGLYDDIYEIKTERDSNYMLPHWAAHITARARSVLLDAIEIVGGECLYCDTDSLKIKLDIFNKHRDNLNIGEKYGQFKIDGIYDEFRAEAPKCYTYATSKNGQLSFSGKHKGLPTKRLKQDDYIAMHNGGDVEIFYKSLDNFGAALKKGNRELKNASRKNSKIENSKTWTLNEDGTIQAIKLGE